MAYLIQFEIYLQVFFWKVSKLHKPVEWMQFELYWKTHECKLIPHYTRKFIWYSNIHKEVYTVTEMPTSGDLKTGDFLFFTTCPPSPGTSMNAALTSHPWQIWEWLRTLYEVLHEVHTIKIRDHRFHARNNLCLWLNRCKKAPEIILRIRKIHVLC